MEQKKEKQRQTKQREQEEGRVEVVQALTSPFLTEDRNTTLRADNPNRHVPYHFKGLSKEQRQAILEEQLRQVEEHKVCVMMNRLCVVVGPVECWSVCVCA